MIAGTKATGDAKASGLTSERPAPAPSLDREESGHDFDARETEALIAAIDGLKALDPAVGSGAFPMGILHKLVFILGKLDPRNEQWEQRQIQRVRDAIATAEKIEDAAIRERTVKELEQQIVGIEEAFERNELDYGRKLYLIENCLYGVDIQSIAVQIAKMRFFISLIVDQRVDPDAPNLGVRPLPNLETKFVAANTLIGIEKPKQMPLRNPQIDAKEAELRRVREKHFKPGRRRPRPNAGSRTRNCAPKSRSCSSATAGATPRRNNSPPGILTTRTPPLLSSIPSGCSAYGRGLMW